MGAASGLSGFRQQKEQAEATRAERKSHWVKIGSNQTLKVRPLQELDEDSKNFVASVGTAKFTTEWQNPNDFTKRIVDTEDEGGCVGREHSWLPSGRTEPDGSPKLNKA